MPSGPAMSKEREPGAAGRCLAEPLATPQEVWQARQQLTPEQWHRLLKAARIKRGGTSFATAEELVEDVLNSTYIAAATGCGGRRWRKSVPFMAHLMMSIKGRAHDDRNCADRRHTDRRGPDRSLHAAQAGDVLEDLLHEESRQERQALIEAVRERVRGDRELEEILQGIEEGRPVSEVMGRLNLDITRYESARRRLRRLLEKLGLRGGRS
jgi:hypothetical protein